MVQARRRPESNGPKSPVELENEQLRQRVHALTRRCEHTEVEYAQSKEYLEKQLKISREKGDTVTQEYEKLKMKYESLTTAAKQLSEKNSKISRLENEKSALVKDVDELQLKISNHKTAYIKLQQENERLRKDCNLAVQLLRCNKSNYQVQKLEELPDDLRERVDDTTAAAANNNLQQQQITLQGYNEYINPYNDDVDDDVDDSDEDEDDCDDNKNKVMVSVDVLADVLEKAENVHVSNDDVTGCNVITDHQLNSSYTARFLDKKLVKVEHEEQVAKLPPPPTSQHKPQKQPAVAEESSPWEMMQVPPTTNKPNMFDDEDSNAAAAYGVYSLPLRRKNLVDVNRPPAPAASVTSSHSTPSLLVTSPEVTSSNDDVAKHQNVDDFEFRQPLNRASKSDDVTPKQRLTSSQLHHHDDHEAAEHHEKTSLLRDDTNSDEDDEHDVIKDDEDDEEEGVDLEWDEVIRHHHDDTNDVTTEESNSNNNNLLLSFDDDVDQVTTTNSIFSSGLNSLIESPPPPPLQFGDDNDDDANNDAHDDLRSSSTSSSRRRNTSMERAQQFGNVLD